MHKLRAIAPAMCIKLMLPETACDDGSISPQLAHYTVTRQDETATDTIRKRKLQLLSTSSRIPDDRLMPEMVKSQRRPRCPAWKWIHGVLMCNKDIEGAVTMTKERHTLWKDSWLAVRSSMVIRIKKEGTTPSSEATLDDRHAYRSSLFLWRLNYGSNGKRYSYLFVCSYTWNEHRRSR